MRSVTGRTAFISHVHLVGVPRTVLGRTKRDRLRSLDEAAAYARCHGERDDNVRIVKLPPRRLRYQAVLSSGEAIRRGFEDRLDTREPESAF